MRTLNQAEKDCRAAWALRPDATHGWCIHHGREWEKLTESIENRIDYILSYKAKTEQVTRLDNMRPVSEASKTVVLSARKAYDEAVAPAEKAYDEAVAPAEKAYDKATASAWKAHNEAAASAWKAHNEAIAPAWKVYNEAIASARKAYNEAIASAHKTDVPNHTWNGTDIF